MNLYYYYYYYYIATVTLLTCFRISFYSPFRWFVIIMLSIL